VTSFLAALEFLTRLRLRRTPVGDMASVARAQIWFPAVGLIIGGLLVAVDRIAMRALPQPSVDVLIVLALVAITGALHLDGLSDAADGLLGGRDRDHRLDIMRDVHIGTFGVVAIVSVLALKWAGLTALPSGVRIEALLLVPIVSRVAVVPAAALFPYARAEGTGAAFHDAARWAPAAATALLAVAASAVLLGVGGLYIAAFAFAGALAVGLYALRSIGGMTGDVHGATIEVSEAVTLLFIAALANRGWIDAWALQ
jgi:adenosylcobinamide-GDP ribazoletransferase